VIEYNRGQITVLDRPQLERLCCECYAVVRKESDRLLPRQTQQEVVEREGLEPSTPALVGTRRAKGGEPAGGRAFSRVVPGSRRCELR
jgi:hypothetical protein